MAAAQQKRKTVARAAQAGGGSEGPAVDAEGVAVVDPTKNVLALVAAANQRQDDLRSAAKELAEVNIAHQKEIGDLRAIFQEKLDLKESQRLDSIRQVDREDVNKTAAQALNAIQTLANTTGTTAETLRTQVATTAQQQLNQRAVETAETNKRLSALELALSEGKGKQQVSDPQTERLAALVETLARAQAQGTGKTEGASALWGFIVGGIGLAIAFITFVNK